jgi:hypothetical protein
MSEMRALLAGMQPPPASGGELRQLLQGMAQAPAPAAAPALPPGFVQDTPSTPPSALDALMAKYAATAANRDQPTSGVTIAPKNGVAREATVVEHVHVHQGGQAIVGHVEHQGVGVSAKLNGSTPCS